MSVCSYFARAAEGRSFHEEDFDASRTFGLPLDNVVLASGFHSGCSVPIRRSDTSIGVVSLSASTRRRDMDGLVVQLEAVADALTPAIERPAAACASRVLVCHADALDAAASTPPDLLICDDWMGGLRVDQAPRELRRAGVDAPLLVVSPRDTPENVRASRLAGASAHIARRDALSSLPAALDAVRDGRTALPDTAGASTQLTAREQQLLENLEEGLRFKQVARRLGISEATAKTHARNLFRKLGATSRARGRPCRPGPGAARLSAAGSSSERAMLASVSARHSARTATRRRSRRWVLKYTSSTWATSSWTRASWCWRSSPGQAQEVPTLGFLITGGEAPIVVDTGFPTPRSWATWG